MCFSKYGGNDFEEHILTIFGCKIDHCLRLCVYKFTWTAVTKCPLCQNE